MDEENILSTASGDDIIVDDEIIVDDDVILVLTPITDSTEIIQNLDLTTSSSIALQVTNLDQYYTGSITYEWTLNEYLSNGLVAGHTQTIDDTGGYVTSPAAIFTGLSSDATYDAMCTVWYSTGDDVLTVWESAIIECVLATDKPDFSGTEIELVGVTDTTITVALTGLDENFSQSYIIQWYLYDASHNLVWESGDCDQSGGVPTSDEYTFSINITPETHYVVEVKIIYDVNGEEYVYEDVPPISPQTDAAELPTSWTLATRVGLGSIESNTSNTNTYGYGEIIRFQFSFPHSGGANFYTVSSSDTIGYLSTTTSYNSNSGQPSSYLEMNDNGMGDGDFQLTCDVDADTTYYLWVRHKEISDSGSITVYFVPPDGSGEGGDVTDEIPNMANVHIVEQETDDPKTKIAFRLEGLDTRYSAGNWSIYWLVYKDGSLIAEFSDDLSPTKDVSTTMTLSGLTPNTTYVVDCSVQYYNADGVLTIGWYYSTDDNAEGDFTTGSENYTESGATINASSSTDGTSITAYVSGLDTSYSRTDRYIAWHLDDEPKGDVMYIDAGASKSGTFDDFTGLTPGSTYTIKAEIWFTNNGSYTSKTLTKPITTNNPRPDDFAWDVTKTQGEVITITADEWTDLQNNINAVRNYKGHSDYSFTSVSTGDDITADIYNECISAINTIHSSDITSYKVTANETIISAEVIDNLRILINAVE